MLPRHICLPLADTFNELSVKKMMGEATTEPRLLRAELPA
ncbi:MAG: hypothetical protein QOJ51_6922 [Acidobacteriaceae bacterium]|jgi:hypothetical protein|nr:hypothetical protein [Acidobacteriaceae bacterium]